jgi:hypothetical protein
MDGACQPTSRSTRDAFVPGAHAGGYPVGFPKAKSTYDRLSSFTARRFRGEDRAVVDHLPIRLDRFDPDLPDGARRAFSLDVPVPRGPRFDSRIKSARRWNCSVTVFFTNHAGAVLDAQLRPAGRNV